MTRGPSDEGIWLPTDMHGIRSPERRTWKAIHSIAVPSWRGSRPTRSETDMSTIAPTQLMTMPADPTWIPSTLYRLTLDQYEAMVESGIFTGRDRVHLIDGFLVANVIQ